jgi:hypothetical protein
LNTFKGETFEGVGTNAYVMICEKCFFKVSCKMREGGNYCDFDEKYVLFNNDLRKRVKKHHKYKFKLQK